MTRPRTGGRRRKRAFEDRTPLPKRPYRDSALMYGVLAAIVVGVAYATGGEVVRALLFGIVFFAVATGWSWWRFHQRLQLDEAEARRHERRERARR